MSIRLITTEQELQEYEQWLRAQPEGNFWQSPQRMAYAQALGMETRLYELRDNGTRIASALVTIDTTALGLCTWEVERGPVVGKGLGLGQGQGMEKGKGLGQGQEMGELMKKIIDDAKKEGCMAVYFSPFSPTPALALAPALTPSNRLVHAEATRIIDLRPSEEDILTQMKPKGRYNIRLARKKGISAEISDDIDGFLELVKKTAKRDRFLALAPEKYRAFYEFIEESFLVMAYHPDNIAKPIAGLLGVTWNNRGVYYYGASDHEYRAFMAPYRVQWKAMMHCKQLGATDYDLLGVMPENSSASHPWQGISEFKEKFGGRVVTYPPEQIVVLRPFAYQALKMKRRLMK